MPVAPFDCATYNRPLQVLKYEGAAAYTVRELNAYTGAYEFVYEIDYFSGHVNGVALYGSRESYYALGSFGGFLCWFDEDGTDCDAAPLAFSTPNAAALVGETYYYAKSPGDDDGDAIYFVRDVAGARDHVDDARFGVAATLFAGAVLDFVGVVEDGDDAYVEDGVAGGAYLVGVADDFSVFVARLDDTDGYPAAYAVLPATVDWDGAAPAADTGGFGAAFSFRRRFDDGATSDEFFFSSNAGAGLFELETPLVVPDACWNAGDATADHVACGAQTARLARKSDSAPTSSNDGMNCPESEFVRDGVRNYAPTAAPTAEPDRRRLRGAPSGAPP